jgi:hypothetical protein
MKKKRVTYGVSGMMEYQAIIKVGRSAMKVLFTDGSMNAMGTNPATYTTDSLMVQHAIENSEQYKRGRIHVVRTVPLDEDVHIERNLKGGTDKGTAPATEPDEASLKLSTETKNRCAADGERGESAVEPHREAITEMEFDNNDDAKDFLESKFGYVRAKLRNRADIVAAGEANGIAISFS